MVGVVPITIGCSHGRRIPNDPAKVNAPCYPFDEASPVGTVLDRVLDTPPNDPPDVEISGLDAPLGKAPIVQAVHSLRVHSGGEALDYPCNPAKIDSPGIPDVRHSTVVGAVLHDWALLGVGMGANLPNDTSKVGAVATRGGNAIEGDVPDVHNVLGDALVSLPGALPNNTPNKSTFGLKSTCNRARLVQDNVPDRHPCRVPEEACILK